MTFHLAPISDAEEDPAIGFLHIGSRMKKEGLVRGDTFTFSQRLEWQDIEAITAWAGLHVLRTGTNEAIVVRQTPKLPTGAWVVNAAHLPDTFTLGRVTSVGEAGWVRVMLHDMRGRPYDTLGNQRPKSEALDARWLLRVCTPRFPLDALAWMPAPDGRGVARKLGADALLEWSPQNERRESESSPEFRLSELDWERRSPLTVLAEDDLLRRGLGVDSQRLAEYLAYDDEDSMRLGVR